MLIMTIWVVGIVAEALLLYRSAWSKLALRYPNFYVYALSLFLADATLYFFYYSRPVLYAKWTYYAGFLVLLLGCGVTLEVFRQVLSRYAGADKIARTASYAVFGAILIFAVAYLVWWPNASVVGALYIVVQRDFLCAQALFLLAMLRVISYYGITMGRNLKGMVLGYGQCIGVTLITRALQTYLGSKFGPAASLIQQISYLAALGIWLVALWSYGPNTVPEARIEPDADYEALATRTRTMVDIASAELIRVERL
jgi:hypothetical protein